MKNFVHGSIWWKCDFHNHTPASNDYGNASYPKEGMSPREWLLGYMRAGINCVGITDHNSGAWIDELKAELQAMQDEAHEEFREMYLFPGVEISVSGGIHVLALFDPSKQSSDIFSLLGAVGFKTAAHGSSDAVTSNSIDEVLNKIVEAGGIAIPAHVDKRSGIFTVFGNRVTAEQALSLNKLLAIEVVDDLYEMPEVYKRKGLALANIAGSDSHSPTTVGSVYTWVKMREPNIEALKLALHDGNDGVIRWQSTDVNHNDIADRFFIHSLKISNGMKAGNGTQLAVNFSPWMTSIIGGRGSGKSSLFNYLRLPFNQTDDLPESIRPDFDRFAKEGGKGIDGMLKSSTLIEVDFFKEGRHLRLEYSGGTKKRRLLEMNAEGLWEIASDELDPSKHFPINVFSQKHLYELAKNPNHILKMVDAKFDKAGWERELSAFEAEWMTLRKRERELESEIKDEPDLKEEVNALNARLRSYESSEKELLTEFKVYNTTNDIVSSNIESLALLIEQLDPIVRAGAILEIVSPDIEAYAAALVPLDEADKIIKSEIAKITEVYKQLLHIKAGLDTTLKSTNWHQGFLSIQARYQTLIAELAAAGQSTEISYDDLLRNKKHLDEHITLVSAMKKELQKVKEDQTKLRETIYAHHKLLRTKRQESISKWDSLDSKRTIAIYLEELRDYTSSEYIFRSLIGKSGSEFESEILQHDNEEPSGGMLYDIMNMQSVSDRWEVLAKKVSEFVNAKETVTHSFGVRLIRHKERFNTQAPEMLDRLLIWAPDDKVVLKLIRDGVEEDIDTGSAGQKTAGMLSLLLTSDDTPLIIDQPEDDLDTRLISELLVDNFKLLKKKRQIIVVTHNPNIAVNGSSEKIVQMEFKNGQIVKLQSGALQDKGVRGAVCEIMEGGKAALDKRYYRISQALESV